MKGATSKGFQLCLMTSAWDIGRRLGDTDWSSFPALGLPSSANSRMRTCSSSSKPFPEELVIANAE